MNIAPTRKIGAIFILKFKRELFWDIAYVFIHLFYLDTVYIYTVFKKTPTYVFFNISEENF